MEAFMRFHNQKILDDERRAQISGKSTNEVEYDEETGELRITCALLAPW